MSTETKTLLFNAVPLFAIAVAYGAVSIAIVPTLWRNRSRATAGDLTVATIFPAIAIVAAIYGVVVATNQTPVADELWLSFAAMLVGLVPAFVFLVRAARAGLVSGGARVLEAEARTTELDRELTAVTELATALVRTQTVEGVGRTIIDEAAKVLGRRVRLARPRRGRPERGDRRHRASRRRRRALGRREDRPAQRAFRHRARGLRRRAVRRLRRADVAARQPHARRARADAKSVAYAPLLAEGRVLAVVTRRVRRETARVHAGRAAPAPVARATRRRSRSTGSARRPRSTKALERERLISRIAGEVPHAARPRHGAARRGRGDGARARRAAGVRPDRQAGREHADRRGMGREPRLEPLDARSPVLPVSNLALRERRTVAVDDIEAEPALDDPSPAGSRSCARSARARRSRRRSSCSTR